MKFFKFACAVLVVSLSGISQKLMAKSIKHADLNHVKQTIKKKENHIYKTDFSGDWIGECDGNQQQIHIKQDNYNIKLSLPDSQGLVINFVISGLKSTHESWGGSEEVTTVHAIWDSESTGLILVNYLATTALNSKLRVINSKLRRITLNMNGDKLILNEEIFALDHSPESSHININCVLRKLPS